MTIDINKAIEALSNNEIKTCPPVKFPKVVEGLNPEQKIAATAMDGNYLVIAGPGTGKTHTLAYRVVYMVKSGVDPKSIVVITFTRKAGNVLKNRINRLLPNTSLGYVGTFHGFANHISSLVGTASPISKFRLLDQEDDAQVHKLVIADYESFNKTIKPQRMQKILSYCYNTKLSVKEYINQFDINDMKGDIESITRYKAVYEHYKVTHMLANYDDMILMISKFLERDGGKKIVAPFEYLMIDEYQDTNRMQLDFINNLNIKNVMAIGDDFQGIYSFRGADHRIILNFYNDFPDAQMIKLVKNYRSNELIVKGINQTVKDSNLGYHKTLEEMNEENGTFKVVSGQSLKEHKDFILKNIKENRDKSHALIYRYNKNRAVFEKALIEEEIEYSVYGGIRLLERKHIKDVLAFLMVYLNKRDVVSFNRILNMIPGVGPKTAKKLILNEMKELGRVSGEKKMYLEQMRDMIHDNMEKEDLYKGVCDYYFSLFEHVESDYYTKDEINQDFKLVGALLLEHDSLHNFITNLILDPVIDMHKGENPKVILTTIHSAKGLEFDYVYYFHTHDWYKNYNVETLEEDRRMFYVGISRAKTDLYIFDHTEYKRSFGEILNDFAIHYGNSEDLKDELETLQDGSVKTLQVEASIDLDKTSQMLKMIQDMLGNKNK